MLPKLRDLGVQIPPDHREPAIVLWCGDGRLQALANALKQHILTRFGFMPFSISISGGPWGLVDRERPDRAEFITEELLTFLRVAPATVKVIYLLMHSDCGRITAIDGCEFSDRDHEREFLVAKAAEASQYVRSFLASDPRVRELRDHQGLGQVRVVLAVVDIDTAEFITEEHASELATEVA